MRKSFRYNLLAGAVVCAVAPFGQSAFAQDAGAGVQEIIVTAQRKSERLQEVPISVNVISGDALAAKGLTGTEDLPSVVPGLTYITTGGAGTAFLRGVGSNAGNPNDEASVATYVDGVYIASSYSNKMKLNNVERVEVLKGPQGTLFGRNATGGVIQVVTKDPKQTPMAEIALGYANYDTRSGSFYGTTGLGENLAIDLAVQGEEQKDGWGFNAIRNEETYLHSSFSARSKLLWTPTDKLTVRLAGDYEEQQSNTTDYRLPPGVTGFDTTPSPSGKYDTTGIITTIPGLRTPNVTTYQKGGSLRVEYDLDFAQFVSISAYRKSTGRYDAEADTVPSPGVEAKLPISQKNFSQEVQLLSSKDSKIDWVIGGYYFDSDAGYKDLIFSGLALCSPIPATGCLNMTGIQHTKSVSAYAQATVEVLPSTKLTGGIRYTDEKQKADFVVFGAPFSAIDDKGFKKATWRIALDHAFTSDIHAYVSHNRGVKGGGYDLLSPSPFNPGFEPEILDAYEAGVKSKLFDNRLRLNAAYFFYDYKNIQVQVIPAGTGGIVQTTNAAGAEIQGLDLDFELVPVEHMSISGGMAYMDGEYTDFQNTVSYSPGPGAGVPIDATGNDTIRTPKWSGNLSGEYRFQSSVGEFPVNVSASYNDGFFFGADNRLKQDSYTLINASVGWNSPDDRFGVILWGSNLTDEYYLSQGVPSGFGDLLSPASPRTYGITVRTRLGG